MPSGVKCLITGGAGFVGAALARRLQTSGASVTLLVRPGSDLWRVKDLPVRAIQADLLDGESLKRVFTEEKPEQVYHLAAHGGYPFQKDARQILETNLLGTHNILEACADSPCRLMVHSGSSSEYGFKKEPMRETDRLEPNSYYAVGKAAATQLCSYAATQMKFPIVTLRLFSVYGPYEEPTRLIPTLIQRALKGETIEMASPDIARDFIHVDDVLDAMLQTETLKKWTGDVFNIGSGIQSTLADAVKVVMQLTGSKSEIRWQSLKPRDWDATHWVASIEKTRKSLGWSPKVSFREGIEKTIAWMRGRP